MSYAVELPESVWHALQQVAKASGMTPAFWIASQLSASMDCNGMTKPEEEKGSDDLEPPTYTSVPLKRVGTLNVVWVPGRIVLPLSYHLNCFVER